MSRHPITSRRRREHGQGLVEMALVTLLLVTLTMGVVEFGRMLMLLNMITNATRDAARAAAVVPASGRCQSNGQLTGGQQTNITGMITTQLANVGIPAADVTVTISYPTANGVPMISVRTDVPIRWIVLINLVGQTLNTSRTVSFRNEVTSGSVNSC